MRPLISESVFTWGAAALEMGGGREECRVPRSRCGLGGRGRLSSFGRVSLCSAYLPLVPESYMLSEKAAAYYCLRIDVK